MLDRNLTCYGPLQQLHNCFTYIRCFMPIGTNQISLYTSLTCSNQIEGQNREHQAEGRLGYESPKDILEIELGEEGSNKKIEEYI